MSKVTRINSLESGRFSNSNNIVHLRIPQGAVYDMSESYVEVEMSVETTDTTPAVGTGVYDIEVRYNNFDVPIFNNVLVRSSRLQSMMKGQLEEINRCDLLQSSLKHYEMSRSDKDSLEYSSLYQLYNPVNSKLSPFVEWSMSGVPSRYARPRFRIPLKELSGLGELINLDTSKTGDLTYRLELNTDKLAATPIADTYELCNNLPTGPQTQIELTVLRPNGGVPVYVGQEISVHGQATPGGTSMFNVVRSITAVNHAGNGQVTITVAALPDAGAGNTYQNVFIQSGELCDDIPQNTAATNSLTINKREVDRFWTGALIRIQAIGNGGAATPAPIFRIITNIQKDTATGNVTVTFDGAAILATGAGETFTSVFMSTDLRGAYTLNNPSAHAPATASLNFEEVDLVMTSANPELPVPEEYQYSTYVLEQHSVNNVSNYNNAFMLDPMCDGALITLSPQVDEAPYSIDTGVQSYRLRINNVNQSQRNVVVDNPLYYDDLLKFFTNDGRRLRNLLDIPNSKSKNLLLASQIRGFKSVVVPVTAPLSAQPKIYNVNINCTGVTGVNVVNLYKSIQKQL